MLMQLQLSPLLAPAPSVGLVPATRWIVGLCSVIFDVDVGQRIDHTVPAGILSADEARDVAFHAFPVRLVMSTIRQER